MIEIKLGDRYANSIFKLAKERGELEAVKNDFLLLLNVCQNNPDFVTMLKSPLVTEDRKQNIINKIFSGKISVMTSKFLEIMIRKKREPWLLDIATRFLVLCDKESNITRGSITSSQPLPPEMIAKIKGTVEKEMKTTFLFEEKIDPELIGGFLLHVGDYLYDGSVSSGLRRLEREFSSNPYVGEFDIDMP